MKSDVSHDQDASDLGETNRAKIRSEDHANLEEDQKQQKRRYDLKHMGPYWKLDELVLLRNSRRDERKGDKLMRRWTSPFEIVESPGKGVYTIRKPWRPAEAPETPTVLV